MNKVYRNNTIIYKVLLFLVTTVAIVYLFPKGGQFKYEFSNGRVWRYDNLYAPFDFAIQKSEDEITIECPDRALSRPPPNIMVTRTRLCLSPW